jgi:dipeptidyl aminopeptidase/acylaminoacyl peptidase
MKGLFFAAVLAAFACVSHAATPVDIESHLRLNDVNDLQISPDGKHYAAIIPAEDRSMLVIIRRADKARTATFSMGEDFHVIEFMWANSERVLIMMGEKSGMLEQPQWNGNLYAMGIDGGPSSLVGADAGAAAGVSRLRPRKAEYVSARLMDRLPGDDRSVLVAITPYSDDIAHSEADRLDVYNGKRRTLARSPVRGASFEADPQGEVRFSWGQDFQNANKLYYRDVGGEWELLNDEAETGVVERPIGFTADGRTAYLQVERGGGPDAIVAFDTVDRSRHDVFRDDTVDPDKVIFEQMPDGFQEPVGVFLQDGAPRTEFFKPEARIAKLYRALEAAFPGQSVEITSRTRDDRLAVVLVRSDRNPGEYFLFDTVDKQASRIMGPRDWVDPEHMGRTRGIAFEARDGLEVHGLLTVPAGSDGKNLPMVVYVHGGPFGLHDEWGFDLYQPDVQILSNAGYAVLQVNFRGSGNYGRDFREAGARQWGLKMQDDLTDATRWAIREGIADADRICIGGASYGAYASLMGVAKEPNLYQCAIGYVGVYDLEMMYGRGDIQERMTGKNYLRDWVGTEGIAENSPANLAGRIKAPVFLAAGGEDERTPIEQSEKMERALKGAGVPVETLYYRTEGHGFYKLEHRRELYQRMLAFLSRHIGGGIAKAGTPGGEGRDAD